MEKAHFWQGKWIDDTELENRLANLSDWINPQMGREPAIEELLIATDALGKLLREKAPIADRLESCLLSADLGTSEEIRATLGELGEFLRRESIERKLQRELGSSRPFLASRIQYDDSLYEAWAPLGFLVHVSPQNAFTVGPLSVLEGLLSGNLNFLKTGGNESLFPQTFLEALADCDPSGLIRERIIVARISSRKKAWLERIFASADGIAAWGGEESIQSIRKMTPSSVRIIEWGHKISFAYVAREMARDEATLESLARETCLLEQQACSSPQCVFVETESGDELKQFGERLAKVLARVSQSIERKVPDDSESAEISMVMECHQLEAAYGHAQVISAPDRSWRVLIDERSALTASPLFRTIWVKPLPKDRILSTLRPMRHYLQTAGLACDLGRINELSQPLLAAGAIRIRRMGEMLSSYTGEPHDGEYALQRYARRVSLQLPQEARGISSFDELRKIEAPRWKTTPPITPKEAFQSIPGDESKAHLYFKSGGSTGEPKLSTFSYDQYHEHMRLGAEGLYAAGFDPIKDRAMNLFFAGGLYGGFISFFSALEILEAVQFPMTAHPDHEMVAKTIVKNRVNALMGMPSYILQLFEKASDELGKYRGVEKIFYGGEHFTDAQKAHLQKNYGVKLIRSGAYGSVDIGPMAFQCTHSEGGVHHLQQKLQYLEILKLDEDRPVHGEEMGRLIFSPRILGNNKPQRYEIGDLGHWILDPNGVCPCGRSSPRFRLLGRMGDIFRIGSAYLNYQKFVHILSNEAGFAGEAQIVLEESGLKEKVTLLYSDQAKSSPQDVTKLCLNHYSDLSEVVEKDQVLLFEAKPVPTDSFERSRGSGKLIRVIDRRKRS